MENGMSRYHQLKNDTYSGGIRMNKYLLFIVVFTLLAIPTSSYAETYNNCESKGTSGCSNKNDKGKLKAEASASGLDARVASMDSNTVSEKESQDPRGKVLMSSQNETRVPCYKEVDMKDVLFRWCPAGKTWTPTNEKRNFCYETSEACAEAEMPQSWCIQCKNK
jgi:hypothetical protein